MNGNKLLFLLITVLAGCGGGESTPTSTNNKVEEEVVDNTPSYLLQTQDSFAVVKPYQEESVSVAEYIPLNAKITKVINDSGDPLCDVIDVTDTGFNVKIDALMPCRYSYQVQTDAVVASANTKVLTSKAPLKNAASGARITEADYQATITVLTSTSDSGLLPPIAITTTSNVTSSIDLKAHLQSYYPNGYVLQDGPILAGNGEIISINKAQQSITFKAGAEGMSRITYTLKGTNAKGEEDLNLGVIDIATSDVANQPPIADSFTFADEQMANGAAVEIDVSEHIRSNDGGDLQLVYVSSLTATVVSSYPNNLTNKIFSFAASTPGTHMVTYGISDHRGGYAIGVVQVNVSGLDYSQWNSLFHNGNMFTAPLTALEASAMGITATSLTDVKEITYTPSIPMATFNYTDAKNYCEQVHKGRLPKMEELEYFFQRKDGNGQPDPDKQPHRLAEGHWPTSATYYFSYSRTVYPDDTAIRLHNPHDGVNYDHTKIVNGTGKTNFYVTCVVPLNVTFTATVTDNNAAANDTALIHVDVKVVDSLGSPSNNDIISVEVLTPQGVTMTTAASQRVSDAGNRFSFKSTTAATVPLKVDYNSNIFLTNITFVADRSTARIVELTKVRDGQPAGRPHLHNAINLVILDAHNNAIPNMKVIISGGNDQANFFANTPDIGTDIHGQLMNYEIGLQRLSYSLHQQTSLMTLKLDTNSNEMSVNLTNTFPQGTYDGMLTIAPALLEQNTLAVGDYSSIDMDGKTWLLASQEKAREHCNNLVYLGTDQWSLTDSYPLMGLHISFTDTSDPNYTSTSLGELLGWPKSLAWTTSMGSTGTRPIWYSLAGGMSLIFDGSSLGHRLVICTTSVNNL